MRPAGNVIFRVLLLLVLSFSPTSALEKRLNGRIVFSSNHSGSWDIWAVDPDGNNLEPVLETPGDEVFPAVSPDGRQIVFVNQDRQLQILTLGEDTPVPLPVPPGISAHPVWRPDGGAIAFVRYAVIPSDQSDLWQMERHDRIWMGAIQLTRFPPMRGYPSYSPDGKKLAFAQFRRDEILGVVEEIGVLEIRDGSIEMITRDQADAFHPVWSPDGKQIAYVSNKAGYYNIWIYHLSEQAHQQVTDHMSMDIDPAWSPDGEEIAFVSARTGNREIWVLSLSGGRLRQITHMQKTAGHPVWTSQRVGTGQRENTNGID